MARRHAAQLLTARRELGPLALEDTLRLLQALSSEQAAADHREAAVEAFSHWLFAETSGQPLYMLETLKALTEQGILAAQAGADGRWQLDIANMPNPSRMRGLLPPRIREVVRTRLARLSPQATTLLSAGAILGQDFSFGQLWRVANLDEDQALSALDELVRSQLVRSAVHLTQGLIDRGALRQALKVAEHAVVTVRAHGIRMLPAVLARLGTVERALQDLGAARAAHEEALSIAERIPGRVFVALAASELCADAAQLGAWAEAHQHARRAAAARPHSLVYVGFSGWFEIDFSILSLHLSRIFCPNNLMSPKPFDLGNFVLRRSKGHNVRTHCRGIFYSKVSEPTDSHHAYGLSRSSVPVPEGREYSRASAHQWRCTGGIQLLWKFEDEVFIGDLKS